MERTRTRAREVAEAIASKDRNNLYVTSSFFTDPVKYRAFCAYYAIMRVVDDRIDDLPSSGGLPPELRTRELSVLTAWERAVRSGCQGTKPPPDLLDSCDFAEADALCEAFVEAYRVFPVPPRLWTSFFAAMRSDLLDGELVRWSDFLSYAEGATVAPTTIYLSLIMARRDGGRSRYELPPGFDLFSCGRNLGIFAYLGHIIRDLASDVTSTATRLCIAREDMLAHGVRPETLVEEASNRRASAGTRRLVGELLQRARQHLARGRALAEPAYDEIEPDGRFILELIVTMYETILEKIERAGCDPMATRHHLTRREKAALARRVAADTGFSLPLRSLI